MGKERVDYVIDCVGHAPDRDKSFRLVRKGGRVVTTNPSFEPSASVPGLWGSIRIGLDVVWKNAFYYLSRGVTYKPMLTSSYCGDELDEIKSMIEKGYVRPVIDSVYPLSEIQKAHERSQSMKAHGKIVIEISRDEVHMPVSE